MFKDFTKGRYAIVGSVFIIRIADFTKMRIIYPVRSYFSYNHILCLLLTAKLNNVKNLTKENKEGEQIVPA